MQLQKIPFRSANAFSEFFLKYIEQQPEIAPFYNRFPSLENFAGQIAEKAKSFPSQHRKVLVDALLRQYQSLKISANVEQNIRSLGDPNTFTITTGHQLAVFTGPLYFIYKIVTVIKTCRLLKEKYPKYNFVPVYWMASEDHDYEEIKAFRLHGKRYTWETEQQGAVGRFHTKDFKKLLSEVSGEIGLFREAYTKSSNLSDAVRHYVNALFSAEGLVVMDADDHALKEILRPVAEDDLFKHSANQQVTDTNLKLEALGLHPQVNPREINLFYLDSQLRSRLEVDGDGFAVVDNPLKFTREEILKKLKETPEVFSPNVILRPLYQEMILPNLAYVGGPAELVYWLELKSTFEHFQVPFPILLPRNFALVIDAPTSRKLGKTRLHLDTFFEPKNDLFNHWIKQHSSHNLSLDEAAGAVENVLSVIQARAQKIDPTLGPMTSAQATKMQTMIRTIEQKMMRAEKRLQSDSLRQIEAVKDYLFPGGSLQERVDNFLNFYQTDPGFIQHLLDLFDPFDFQFHVLTYHDKKGTSKVVS